MAIVLFLYSGDQGEDTETLKDYVQTQLGTSANLTTVADVLAEDSRLDEALVASHCVVLINSEKSSQLIIRGGREVDGNFITFDGQLVRQFISREENLRKLIVVFLGERFESEWIPEDLGGRVFVVAGTRHRGNPVVDHMIDTIRSVVAQGNPW